MLRIHLGRVKKYHRYLRAERKALLIPATIKADPPEDEITAGPQQPKDDRAFSKDTKENRKRIINS